MVSIKMCDPEEKRLDIPSAKIYFQEQPSTTGDQRPTGHFSSRFAAGHAMQCPRSRTSLRLRPIRSSGTRPTIVGRSSESDQSYVIF